MDLKQIKELMAAMGRAGIDKMVWKQEGDFELLLESHPEAHPIAHYAHSPATFVQDFGRPLPEARGVEPVKVEKSSTDDTSRYITSPMVGTFYSRPSPDDPSFIRPGDRIEPHTVVCIVEAMKVMNEVKAGVSGTVVEVLVDNASPVEFGTKLFRIG